MKIIKVQKLITVIIIIIIIGFSNDNDRSYALLIQAFLKLAFYNYEQTKLLCSGHCSVYSKQMVP